MLSRSEMLREIRKNRELVESLLLDLKMHQELPESRYHYYSQAFLELSRPRHLLKKTQISKKNPKNSSSPL